MDSHMVLVPRTQSQGSLPRMKLHQHGTSACALIEAATAQAKMSLRHAIALRRTMHGVNSFEAEMDRSSRGNQEQGETPAEAMTASDSMDEWLEGSPPPDTIGGEAWRRCGCM